MTREQALALADHHDRQAQDLIDRYGTSVRPSWVSAEVAHSRAQAQHLRQAVAETKENRP